MLYRGEFLARFHKPSRIFFLAHDPNRNRHIGMVLAANLGTLAVINALTLGFEPSFVHPARNRVDADAKGRNREGMDHIRRGHLKVDNFPDGHHSFVVDGKLTDITRLQVSRLDHLGIEFETAALILGIAIRPVPLLTSHLYVTSAGGMVN